MGNWKIENRAHIGVSDTIFKNSREFLRILKNNSELFCQIETHLIQENSWEFPRSPRRGEILIDEPRIFQEFPRIL